MNCPIDGTALVMSERSGIEIDYCPQCRGVWLDRGELDKIVERAGREYAPEPPRHDDRHEHREPYTKKKHKKRDFFSELFEFGD